MAVGEPDHRQPSARPSARVRTGVRINEIGRDGRQAPPRSDRRDVARPPAITRGIIGAQEAALGLGDPEQSGHRLRPLDLTIGADGRIASASGHEAAIDQDGEAPVVKQWRHDPEAAAGVGHRLNQGFLVVQESTTNRNAAVLILVARHAGPLGRARRGKGGRVNASIDLGDQIGLPGQALNLPTAQRQKADEQRQARDHDRHAERSRTSGLAAGRD